MTTLLYIILGISIGVGATLTFLQERFSRERRLIIAASKAEQESVTTQLKELDEKWEVECEQDKQELATLQAQVAENQAAGAPRCRGGAGGPEVAGVGGGGMGAQGGCNGILIKTLDIKKNICNT